MKWATIDIFVMSEFTAHTKRANYGKAPAQLRRMTVVWCFPIEGDPWLFCSMGAEWTRKSPPTGIRREAQPDARGENNILESAQLGIVCSVRWPRDWGLTVDRLIRRREVVECYTVK